MSTDWQAGLGKFALAIALGSVTVPCWESMVLAQQIIPDDTLGAESSVVTPDKIKGMESERISGGAVRGSNLFHSFREFNIGEGRGGYFENPAAIENIFSRVTGSNPSEILGTLGVLGNANLFFLNPNGIIFGQNASLDLRGSFLGTTADSIVFPDGKQFSATNPESAPLLTVNVQQPIGLQFEGREGVISHQGLLAVDPGQNLALVGGDVTLDGGSLIAPGGRVELGGLSEAGEIGINADASLSFPDGVARADVSLTNEAEVNVSAGGGGSIAINSRNLEILGTSKMRADIVSGLGSIDSKAGDIEINATGATIIANRSFISNIVIPEAVGNAGNINITTSSLSLKNFAVLQAATLGKGDAGSVIINADTVSFNDDSAVLGIVGTTGVGKGGNIDISTGNLYVTNGSQLTTSTFGQGDAGSVIIQATDTVSFDGVSSGGFRSAAFGLVRENAFGKGGIIKITTSSLSVTNGAQLVTSSQGQGDAGSVIIQATDNVFFDGGFAFSDLGDPVSGVGENASGKGGNINITTGSLFVTNGGQLATSTFAQGDAGSVIIQTADTVSFDGTSSDGRFSSAAFSQAGKNSVGQGGSINITTGSLSVTNGALLASVTRGKGDAGNIDITTENLSVTNGAQLQALTSGQGNAGSVAITATDRVSFDGIDKEGFSSAVFSTVEENGEGQGGSIAITTGSLSVTNGAALTASTFGEGKAGSITVTANTFEAMKGGQLLTTTSSNFSAGDIILRLQDNLLLSGTDSGLFAQTAGEGKAGNITVNTPQLTIDQGASISAFTEASGDGGTITVNAPQVVLLTDNSQLIVETSGAGKPGDIIITTPNLTIGKDAEISATATQDSTNTEGGSSIIVNASNLDLTGKLGIFAETQGEAPAGTLNIQPDNNKPNLDIQFTDTAIISASTTASGTGGNINLTAPETINITGQGKIAVETTGSGDAGSINITTQQLNVSNQTEISASTSGTGSAGSITVLGTDSVFLDNSSISTTVNSGAIVDAAAASNIEIQTSWLSLTNNAQVSASTAGVGNAGDINLEAIETLSIDNSTVSSAVATGGVGNAGNVNLTAPSISVTDGSIISTATNGEGNAGTVKVTANEEILISGSTASSAVEPEGVGNAGTVRVKAPQISLSGGSFLSSSTAGTGDAGRINITTEDLNLSNQTEISASTFSSGKGGDINITANNFNLEEGATVITDTASSGQAGDIQLQIRDNLNLVNSIIAASTAPNSTGRGGSITIDPQKVTLNKSQIAVTSKGSGTGGNINLQADALTLANQSAITAETFSTDGGNIEINLGGNLVLRDKSQISASAGTDAAGGNGGNITIDTPFIIAFPQENSDITANAFEGDGGKITINANGILGIEFRDQQTPLSDITASSEFGQQGEVEINTSGIDPTRGLSNLPQDTVEVEVAQGCQTTGGQSTLEFFAIGRGGLPPSPDELFSSEIVIAEWIPLEFEADQTLDAIFSEAEFTTTTLLKLSCH